MTEANTHAHANQAAPSLLAGLITVEQAAAELGKSERTLRVWMAAGKITYIRVGKTPMFDRTALSRELRENTIKRCQPSRRRMGRA